MVKQQSSQYEDVLPLPVSTRDPGEEEGAGLLNGHGGNNSSSNDKRVGAFDVEFDIEDDVLLNWQHARPSGWFFKWLPRSLQQVPECWLRLSQQQRSLAVSGAIAAAVLLLCLTILVAAWSGRGGSHKQQLQYTPKYMSAKDSPLCSWSDLYLPGAVRPSKYTLHVKTTLQEPYVVNGQVDIQLTAAQATPCVVLHAYGMEIKSVAMLVYQPGADLHKQQPVTVKGSVLHTNKTSQHVILQFPQAVPLAPFVPMLQLVFSYPLAEGLDGFYRSSYIDAANETKVLASTQFESIAARKAFPCFDEPSFKAVFEIKVSAPPPPVVVLSNMPLSHTHEHTGGDKHSHSSNKHADSSSSSSSKKAVLTEADLIAYHFHATPLMSTYLVAWVVGELSHNERQCELALPPPTMPSSGLSPAPPPAGAAAAGAKSSGSSSSSTGRGLKHGGHSHGDDDGDDEHHHKSEGLSSSKRNVTVRVWGTNDRVAQFGHARDVACGALQEMERLTQVSFALPKLDLVAIPNFAAGAMENWGLLMYRERSLLVDDSRDDMHQRYAIATTVSHETAHQWFGNLATLSDWTELWINEGFATYFEAVLADAYQPGMGYLTNFFADTTSVGLEADGSLASHPLSINRPVRQLSETDNWFDSVSYDKGAAMLRMVRAWVNRDSGTATGLTSNDDAPSAAAAAADSGGDSGGDDGDDTDDEESSGKFASTSQQWAPHLLLRRRLLLLSGQGGGGGRGAGAAAALGVGSSTGSGSSRISAAGVPRVLPGRSADSSSSSSDGDEDSSSSSSREPADARTIPWTSHRYSKGPSVFPIISAAPPPPPPAAAAADAAVDNKAADASTSAGKQSLVVLPADAPLPPPHSSRHAHSGHQQHPARLEAAAVSVGSSAAWETQHSMVQGLARELDGGSTTTKSAGSTESSSAAGSAGAAAQDKFMHGLTSYLHSHAYANSNYSGLWHSVGAAVGEPLEQMMSTWTLRRGFPIVTVSLGEPDGGSSSSRRLVKLEQVPYHAPRTYMVGLPFEPEMYCNDWSDDPADSSWWVPVPIRLPGVNNFQWHSFNSCSTTLQVDMPHNTPTPWVLANTGRFGFYRVNYSEPLWSALAAVSQSPHAHISSIDLAGLLDDAYSLSHVRQLNISIFLQLVQALGTRARPELPPWATALGWLQRMTDVLSTAAMLNRNGEGSRWKDCMSHLHKFATRKVTQPFIEGVSVPGQEEPGLSFKVSASDPPELRLLRPVVLEAAGFLGYTQAMNAAVDLLDQQAGGHSDAVAPDVAKAVYALAAASGSETAYSTLVHMYEQALDAADKDRALRALARVTTKPLISKTLEYALSPAVRTQDVSVLLVRLGKQGGLGFNMTWQFVIDRADDILKKYGGEDVTYILGRRLNELAKLFVDEDLLDQLKALGAKKPQLFSPTFFDEANEARMLNHDWLRFQGADACKWLASAVRRH